MKLAAIFNSILSESSLSRVWQHVTNGDTFAVISAFRGSNDLKQNVKLHNELKNDVRGMGYGYIEQKSGYTYSNPGTGEDERVEEMSIFVPKIDLAKALKLGNKYNQESILFKDNDKFVLINCDTKSIDMKFAKKSSDAPLTFKPDVLKYAYSQLSKGNANAKTPYAFKGVDEIYEMKVPSRTESILASKSGKLASGKWIKIQGQ